MSDERMVILSSKSVLMLYLQQ